MAGMALRQAHRGQILRAHLHRAQPHFQIYGKAARSLIGLVPQIGQGMRIAFGTRRLRVAEGRQGFGRDDPGRHGGQEVLGEEGTKRLIFPRLEVARRPIVQQAKAADMARGIGDRNGGSQGIAFADPHAQFKLEIETARRTETWRFGVRRSGLAVGTDDGLARRPDRGGAAVITDRHVLVIGQKRRIRAEQRSDLGGVMDADIEVGIVADAHRQMDDAVLCRMEVGFGSGAVALVVQAKRQLLTQGFAQGRCCYDGRYIGWSFAAEARGNQGLKLQNVIADGDAGAWRFAGGAEQAERQVLNGEVSVAVGRGNPGGALRVVGVVDHRSCALAKPCQQAS